jgi:hypothetical protein
VSQRQFSNSRRAVKLNANSAEARFSLARAYRR